MPQLTMNLGGRTASSLYDKNLKAPMPRNMLNKISGGSNLTFFPLQNVERQGAFEAAAQRIALDERYRNHRQMEADHHVIGNIDAVMRTIAQCFDVARANAFDKTAEIAAEILGIRKARTADNVFDRRTFAPRQAGSMRCSIRRTEISSLSRVAAKLGDLASA